MRHLPGVIEEILDEIPETETALRTELAMFKRAIRYVAPEAMQPHCWLCGDSGDAGEQPETAMGTQHSRDMELP